MHDQEKSDLAIVAAKPPNKAGSPVAEVVERRRPVEGKVSSNACSGRSAGLSMSQKQRPCGSWRPNPRSRLTFDESPLRESCTVGSVGEVPGNWHLYPTSTSAPSRALASVRVSAKRRQGSA